MMMFWSSHFNPLYIGFDTGVHFNKTLCFDEDTGLNGSKTVKKKPFIDHKVPEVAVGQITSDELGHCGSAMAIPKDLNDSYEHGDQFPSQKNRYLLVLGAVHQE
jgi:hypothetical protein